MKGKIAAGFIMATALIGAAFLWWQQVYAYYQPVDFAQGADEIRLTSLVSGAPEVIVADNVEGIDADTSPLRFRACFTTPLSQAMLSETYQPYEKAVPLTAPSWFGCFNAAEIGAALERGEALAFLSEHDITQGVDRVVAVFPDGRAFAWHQLNDEMKD